MPGEVGVLARESSAGDASTAALPNNFRQDRTQEEKDARAQGLPADGNLFRTTSYGYEVQRVP